MYVSSSYAKCRWKTIWQNQRKVENSIEIRPMDTAANKWRLKARRSAVLKAKLPSTAGWRGHLTSWCRRLRSESTSCIVSCFLRVVVLLGRGLRVPLLNFHLCTNVQVPIDLLMHENAATILFSTETTFQNFILMPSIAYLLINWIHANEDLSLNIVQLYMRFYQDISDCHLQQ